MTREALDRIATLAERRLRVMCAETDFKVEINGEMLKLDIMKQLAIECAVREDSDAAEVRF